MTYQYFSFTVPDMNCKRVFFFLNCTFFPMETLMGLANQAKMWIVCKNLYEKTQNCVLVGQERTRLFVVERGSWQGCVLSPILFSICINTLTKEIIDSGIGIKIGNDKIGILLYADDIVINTDMAQELKIGLKFATNCGKKWRCSFNKDKSQGKNPNNYIYDFRDPEMIKMSILTC